MTKIINIEDMMIKHCEINRALKIAQEGILYAKDPRDARIMIAVNQGNATVTGINLMLEQEGLPILK